MPVGDGGRQQERGSCCLGEPEYGTFKPRWSDGKKVSAVLEAFGVLGCGVDVAGPLGLLLKKNWNKKKGNPVRNPKVGAQYLAEETGIWSGSFERGGRQKGSHQVRPFSSNVPRTGRGGGGYWESDYVGG